MKKIFFILLLHLLSVGYVFSQSIYAGVSAGMDFGVFPSKTGDFMNVKNDDNDVSIQQPAFSLGSGFNISISGGYFFNDYLGFDIEMQLRYGKKVKFHQETLIMTVVKYRDIEIYGKRTVIVPSFIIRIPDMKLTPYFKIGPSFGFINQKFDEVVKIDTNQGVKKWSYGGKTAIGLNIETGLTYNLSDQVQGKISMVVSNMVYEPDNLTLMSYQYNNKDAMSNLNTSEKEKVFVDWTGDPFNSAPDPKKPEPLQKQYFSYNSFSLELGVYFLF